MDPEDMDYLLTRIANRIRRGFVAMVREVKDANSLRELESRIARGDVADLLADVDSAAEALAVEVNTGYVQAGQRAARWIDSEVEARVTFDLADDDAVAWMTDQADTLVRAMVREQQDVARRVVELGRQRGLTDLEIASNVQASVGLNMQQVDYVESYRDALEGGDWSNALGRELADGRYDGAIERVDAADGELSADRVDAMVDAYRDNWVDYRSDFVADTEGNSAMNAGVDEAVDQAVDAGDLESAAVTRTWITRDDPKVRTSHRSLHGATAGPGEDFETSSGVLLRYPGDEDAPADETANCRCVLDVDIDPAIQSPGTTFRQLDSAA